jgi:hypothetical protein
MIPGCVLVLLFLVGMMLGARVATRIAFHKLSFYTKEETMSALYFLENCILFFSILFFIYHRRELTRFNR